MIGAPNSLNLNCKVRIMKEAPGPSVSEEIADIFRNYNIDNNNNNNDNNNNDNGDDDNDNNNKINNNNNNNNNDNDDDDDDDDNNNNNDNIAMHQNQTVNIGAESKHWCPWMPSWAAFH